MAVSLHQRHYRFGNDDGTEAAHTWKAAIDTTITMQADSPFLLRIAVWEEGVPAGAANNTVNQFQCRRNGGAWQNITTTSTICKAVAVSAFTNGQNCTQRLGAHGTFESSAAGCTEDGNSGGNTNDIVAGGSSETEAGLQLVGADLVQGDTIDFRLVTTPTAIAVYDVTPSLTVTFLAQTLTVPAWALAADLWTPTVTTTGVTPPSRIRLAYLAFEVPDAPSRQHARPKRDVSAGSWTASSGSDLWEMVNEVDASDADYITSSASPSNDAVTLELTGINLPVAGTCSVLIRRQRI